MILETLLGRLHANLTSGPSLNARPHNSRQRLDITEFKHLASTDPAMFVTELLGKKSELEIPAKVPVFIKPEAPEEEWTDVQRKSKNQYERQVRVLNKLRDIAEDATEYFNDQGEHALYIGFPLISIPSHGDRGVATKRILAPVMLVPVNIRVRRGAGAGVSIALASDGADMIQANPGLMAWLEQQTGLSSETLFTDEQGEDPWREVREALAYVEKAAVTGPLAFNALDALTPIPRTEDLPTEPAIVPGAVLGLFPLSDPGLMRDTKWMIQHEADLDGPVKAFLSIEALAEPEEVHVPEAVEHDHAAIEKKKVIKDHAAELLITLADPCQTEAVHQARTSKALVVHGPPGTGKSQTIANIIGDHLARGQRVLFVCDKRTALDVVKYRLDSMGIGHLCGVVHDPQRDRKDLYMGIRAQLDQLIDGQLVPDPTLKLALINERLDELYMELRGYFEKLHGADTARAAFHQLCGEWLDLQVRDTVGLSQSPGLTMEMIERHRTDIEEIIKRSAKAKWQESPFRNALQASLESGRIPNERELDKYLYDVINREKAIEGNYDSEDPHLPDQVAFSELAVERIALANALDKAGRIAPLELFDAISHLNDRKGLLSELAKHGQEGELLKETLDHEIRLHLGERSFTLPECNQHLMNIQAWEAVSTNWRRYFSGKVKTAAKATLAALGMPLGAGPLNRAKDFLKGVRARQLFSSYYLKLAGPPTVLPSDQALLRFVQGMGALCQLADQVELPNHASYRMRLISSLGSVADREAFIQHLRRSAEKCTAIKEIQEALEGVHLFKAEVIQEKMDSLRHGTSISDWLDGCKNFLPTLDDALRLMERLQMLPLPLEAAMNEVVTAGMTIEQAEPSLKIMAFELALKDRIQEEPELSRIDSERIESGFAEMLGRTQEKTELVREKIKHDWQTRARKKLLAATGSRLNNKGAALRQRLFVRGQKAMKLRQMIATGADRTEGDPLFDLCPVWMASPSTVSQIFPKEALFDVVIFDEASQCRLEEALPVLLRGKRLVVAGDPKQLPPTRFFEGALTESDDGDAENVEELFMSRQAQAEDLLSSALNLNVQEAFLDVHYRSRNEALIGFSNDSFYEGRLQPIPGHPGNKLMNTPIELVRVDGTYKDRSNLDEAKAVVELVAGLLAQPDPPSLGIACFNITQRDAILDELDNKAAIDAEFAQRLGNARRRKGRDSFEGLFVKNLENVQGDERDHMIICTTFGLDKDGKFRRNFGALSRSGGERRLNVLVTRAREKIHVLTSIPRTEYMSTIPMIEGQARTGRHYLYAYLRFAEQLAERFKEWRTKVNALHEERLTSCELHQTNTPSLVTESVGKWLSQKHGIGNLVYWGNDGFCVDVALVHPSHPADVTVGVLTDFTRYRKTPDPILWELFRSAVLIGQGWELLRLWTPSMFKNKEKQFEVVRKRHQSIVLESQAN